MKRISFFLLFVCLEIFASTAQAGTLYFPDPDVPLELGKFTAIFAGGGEQVLESSVYVFEKTAIDGLIALKFSECDAPGVSQVRFTPGSGAAYAEACANADLVAIQTLYPYTVVLRGANAARVAKVIGYAKVPDPTCTVPIDLETVSVVRRHTEELSAEFTFCFVSGEDIMINFGVRNPEKILLTWHVFTEDMRGIAPGESISATLMIPGGASGKEAEELTLSITKGMPIERENAIGDI